MTTQERPLVLKAPQVLALLNGATQLRLPISPQPPEGADLPLIGSWGVDWSYYGTRTPASRNRYPVGSCFWVKETWTQDDEAKVYYRADGESGGAAHGGIEFPGGLTIYPGGWNTSPTMPRWASRIVREVVSVRVERVQDISDADAEASGAQFWSGGQITPADMYSGLWEESYGPGSWDRNEWCWVYEIKEAPCSKS